MLETYDVEELDRHTKRLIHNVHPPDWENPTPAGTYNLVVIGGGTAGLVAAAGAAILGAKVALIERHLLGGDCLNTGCVPSKSLLRSARVIGELQRATSLGIHIDGEVTVDFARVMERMRRVRADISEHDSVQRFTDMGVDVFLGDAQFSGLNTIAVEGMTLHFKKAVIATGSRPAVPPIEGLADAGYLTSETFFELTEQPRKLAVIGAGATGCELAQAMARFGTQVTLFEVMPRVLPHEDEDVSRVVAEVLERDGVELRTEAEIEWVSTENGQKVLQYEWPGEQDSLAVDAILVVAGRTPNVAGLNLDEVGVHYDESGIIVDDYLQTSNADVYASGDVCLPYKFTHAAEAASRIVLRNALFPGPKRRFGALVIPRTTYTDPEVAHVGLDRETAEDRGIAVQTFGESIAATDRGRADGEPGGFVKIHVKSGTDQIIGATVVAPHAGDMIGQITTAMVAGAGLKTLFDVIYPYPTQSDAIKTAAIQYSRGRLRPLIRKALEWWFRLTRSL